MLSTPDQFDFMIIKVSDTQQETLFILTFLFNIWRYKKSKYLSENLFQAN